MVNSRLARLATPLGAMATVVALLFALAPSADAARPLDTVLDSTPLSVTNQTTATVAFHSTRTPATFVCRLDGATATACTSPVTYSGLTPTVHTLTVAATSGGSTDASPASYSWTVDTTPPAAPTGLVANAPTPTSIALSWTPGTEAVGIAGYEVHREDGNVVTIGAVTSWTDTTVSAASGHTYYLVQRDTAGNVSPSSASVSATTPLAVTAPDTVIDSAPPALTASTSAQLSFHSTVSGSTFTCRRDGGTATACSSPVTYTGLTQGPHTVTVTATANGVTDATPATAAWSIDTTAPTAPTGLTGVMTSSSVGLSWTASTDNGAVVGYDVLRDKVVIASAITGTTYTDSSVTLGGIYSYSVRARDGAGNVSAVSGNVSYQVMAPYDPHLTRAPYLTDLVEKHVAINFATDRSATSGSVVYGAVVSGTCSLTTTVAADRVSIQVGPVAEYQWTAQVDLLASGTYCYRVYLGGTDLLAGNLSPRFTSQNVFGSTSSFTFGVMGDWGQVGAGGVNEDQSNLLAQVARSGSRFVMTVGDNGYPNGSQVDYGDLQQTATSAIFGARGWTIPGATTPIFAAVGNHGLAGVTHTDITTWTQRKAVAASGGRYQNDVYCCVNNSFSANYGSEWYAFDVGNARFYVLDSAWGDTNGGDATPYANDALAHFAPGTPQYEWLLNDLKTHTPQLKFAFSHYPFYADNPDQSSDPYLQGAANLEGLLGSNGVQMVFNGHTHIYERNTPSAAGMPITYVTGGGGATPQPVGPCTLTNDAYAIGWSPSKLVGSACGRATAPKAAANVFHFLKVTVNGTSVTVAPTDSLGNTFDVQTYSFKVAPDTYFDTTPPIGTTSSSATFSFHSSTPGATFTCSRDGAAPTSCSSPVTYTGLAQGAHKLVVTATANKAKDATPATWSWTVDSTSPTTPGAPTASATGPFAVAMSWSAASDNTGVTGYDLYRDGKPYQSLGAVTSYVDSDVHGGTTYSYQVLARDVAGNTSALTAATSVTTPAAPVPVFADSFETGSLSRWTSSRGLVLQQATVHGGVSAVETDTAQLGSYASKALATTYPDAYARVWFDVVSQTDQVNLLRFRDSAGASLGYVFVSATGALGFRDDATAKNILSTVTPQPGWHALELRMAPGATAGASGTVQVWLDNALVPELSSTAIDIGTAPIGSFQIGDAQTQQVYDVAYDDAAFGTSRLGTVADTSAPAAPTSVSATASSPFTVDVSWTAAIDDVGVIGYDVLRDGIVVASLGAVTSYTDQTVIDRSTYTYSVRARDLAGNTSADASALAVTTAAAAPPLFADGFESGLIASPWVNSGLNPVSSPVSTGSHAAEAPASTTTATFAKATLPGSYPDAYARVKFQVTTASGATQVTLLRLRDSTTGSVGFVTLSQTGRLGFTGGPASASTVTLTSSVVPGAGWHSVELHVVPNGSASTVQVWLDGLAVPGLSGTSIDLTGSGPVSVLQIGDTTASGWDVVYDDVAFGASRLGPVGDVVAPSAPTDVSAVAQSPFSVGVSWTASTDDIGVAGYDVLRDGDVIGSVSGGVTSFVDTTVVDRTSYAYAVRAIDFAGNPSTPSLAAPVTTAAAAPPLFADGFEAGAIVAPWANNGLAAVSSPAVTGSFAAEAAGSGFAKATLPGSYPDAYARVKFQVTSASGATQVTLLRLRDSTTGSVGFVTLSQTGRLGFTGGPASGSTVSLTSSVVPGAGWHSVEVHVAPNGSASIVQVWLDGVLIPSLSGTNISLGTAGAVTVLQVGDTTAGGWDVVFDDVAFGTSRLGPVGDVVAPTAPVVTATATSAFSVDVSWSASTDDVGVVGYDVLRNGSLLASVASGATSYTDSTALASTTYTYAVRARDFAGNAATGSSTVTTAAAAALVFADGFESGFLDAWTGTKQGLTVQAVAGATGSYAAEGTTTVGKTFVQAPLGVSYPDSYARVKFQVKTKPSSLQASLIRLRDAAGGSLGNLVVTSGGKLNFTSGGSNGATAVTKLGALALDAAWHSLELHLQTAGGSSIVQVWLDGTLQAELSGQVDLGTATGTAILQIGDNTNTSSTWDLVFDDAAFSTSRIGL